MSDAPDQDQKTEEPTQKKLDDAAKKGDVAKSQEMGNLFVLAGGTMVVMLFAGPMSAQLFHAMRGQLANLDQIATDQHGLMQLLIRVGLVLLTAMALPFLFLVVAGIAGQAIQHKINISAESLKPKLSKLSPLAGFKRIFGKEALVNFAKGLFKIGLVATVLIWVIWPERLRLDALLRMDLPNLLPATQALTLKLLMAALVLIAMMAAADYFYQYRKWHKRQMMTIQEMKEEFKQSEGNPEIKGKIKQLQRERSRRRMMAEVPKATVVVTNPTHFAVALKYEEGMAAPICVAKGADIVAFRIREVAAEAQVPVVENPPLARTLYATIDIDDEVPEDHYKAVAEVITYVLRLKRGERIGAFRPST